MLNYLIYGLGKSGIASAKLLLKTANVFLFDENLKKTPELKQLTEDGAVLLTEQSAQSILPQINALVLSPGVSVYCALAECARELKIKVLGELEIGFTNTDCKIIAVTGTNGKTTVSSMIHAILCEAGLSSHLAGNIGTPLCSLTDEIKPGDWCVVETSSFQLETVEKYRPHIAVMTNITPDHIDRHKSFENYALTKAKIFKNQTYQDFAVINAGDETVKRLTAGIQSKIYSFSTKEKTAGAYLAGGFLFFSPDGEKEEKIIAASRLKVAGLHNVENALCAITAAGLAGVSSNKIAAALEKFLPLEHRMEICGQIGEVLFVNDSKATNTDSALPAINGFTQSVCVILGGRDKGCSFDPLFDGMKATTTYMVFFGEAADKLAQTAKRHGKENFSVASSLEEAMRIAYLNAKPSGVVLLSPACSSFDMFKNYEERGEKFKEIFRKLKDEIEI